MAPRRSPIDFVSGKDLEDLGHRLSREIQDGLDARQRIVGEERDIDEWHKTYEGGDRELTKTTPWVGAANLTSYIGTEKTDAWRARVMQTVFTEPFWFVEGFGESAARAADVEDFHQWKAEEERIQAILGKVFHNSFVEGTGVLEVAERPRPRVLRRTAAFQPLTMPTGEIMLDPAKGTPVLARDEQGQPVEVDEMTPNAIRQEVDEVVNVAAGPVYRVIGLKDYVALPGHATDVQDVWAHAKRVWIRKRVLEQRAKAGFYANVDQISLAGQPVQRAEHTRMGQDVVQTETVRDEVEIWEMVFLDDLENLGTDTWYVATLSVADRVILRLKRLVVGSPTFILFTPLPRSNSVYGYSLVGHKLGTVIDEHTSIRNQITDRSTIANSAPIRRVMGSLWDPMEQPWGPGVVIDVRDPGEVEAMTIPDVPGSVIQREAAVLSAGERVSGLNDVAAGVNPQQDRTLGEVQLVSAQSFVRVEEAVKYLQEPLEQLWALRHELWKRAAREGTARMPSAMIAVLEGRGVQVPSELVDPALLEGTFRGKPRASVEGADPNRLRSDFVGFMGALAQLAPVMPALQQQLNTPDAVQGLLRQLMRVFSWKDPRVLRGLLQPMQPPGTVPGAPGMPGAPMMPPAAAQAVPRGLPALPPSLWGQQGPA